VDLFDQHGALDPAKCEPEVLAILVEATRLAVAPLTRSLRCKPGHVLLALWPTLERQPDWGEAIETALKPGCSLPEIPSLITSYVGDSEQEQAFELHQRDFDPHVLAALNSCDRIENQFGDVVWESQGRAVGVLPLWIAILCNPSSEDREAFGSVMDFTAAAAALVRQLTGHAVAASALPPLFADDGSLALECFDDAGVALLEAARDHAGGLGSNRIRSAHLLLALLERPDGVTDEVVRLQIGLNGGPHTISQSLTRAISGGPSTKPTTLTLHKGYLSEVFQSVLEAARTLAARNEATHIGERFLLRSVLDSEREGLAGQCLSSPAVGLDLDVLLRDVNRRIADFRRGRGEEPPAPFLIPGSRCDDLTWLAQQGRLAPSVGQDQLIEAMLRGLHKRQDRHVLVTGEPGVGKTTLVREFGRRVGLGQIPFFNRKKVVLVDCDGLAPERSRELLLEILAAVKGRRDVLLVLDHFEAVVRYAGARESHNRDLLRVALRQGDVHLVGVCENRQFADLLGHDHSLLGLFTRVDVGEVDVAQAVALIGRTAAPEFEKLYGVRIESRAIERAAQGAREFILSSRLPVKAINSLRDACEWLSYEREMGRGAEGVVGEREVVRALAQRTGIDEETIAGSGSRLDFAAEFSKSIVGQEAAVRTVADRLTRIKAGSTREGKPAAVFLFAGLTGTGKTELAKAVARLYSARQRLSVYSMTRFTQPHSIQGLTGVPPGYVGYESGGRLINDLNADSYGVILFDEAEKAHPDIWQSMLSLFDEAWIEDHRNVRAYGNRAIFILTSNAGQDFLREHYRTMSSEALREEVARRLVDYRNPDTGLRPFSPEFLGRFTDIVVFNPLTDAAMHGIARLQVEQLQREWRSKRGKQVRVDPRVLDQVAVRSHAENERFGGTKGGRIVSQWLGRLVEDPLLRMMIDDGERFREATTLHVVFDANDQPVIELNREWLAS
jgi:ATP-dependent Clp protease ATP-binding subunit ClpA